ncbi:hypothetical protein KP509_06G069500 [Ceratopteris richardii]|nr:hypothetical protein KP509_06G069500 [Ceratopteris richardii]
MKNPVATSFLCNADIVYSPGGSRKAKVLLSSANDRRISSDYALAVDIAHGSTTCEQTTVAYPKINALHVPGPQQYARVLFPAHNNKRVSFAERTAITDSLCVQVSPPWAVYPQGPLQFPTGSLHIQQSLGHAHCMRYEITNFFVFLYIYMDDVLLVVLQTPNQLQPGAHQSEPPCGRSLVPDVSKTDVSDAARRSLLQDFSAKERPMLITDAQAMYKATTIFMVVQYLMLQHILLHIYVPFDTGILQTCYCCISSLEGE